MQMVLLQHGPKMLVDMSTLEDIIVGDGTTTENLCLECFISTICSQSFLFFFLCFPILIVGFIALWQVS